MVFSDTEREALCWKLFFHVLAMMFLLSWIYLLVSCACVDAEKNCIRFHVPQFESFTVAEDTRKTIHFSVTDQCHIQSNISFDVLRGRDVNTRICGIKTPDFLNDGTCSCTEDGRNLSCNLAETFDQSKTKWTFLSGAIGDSEKEKVKTEIFNVNVTYDTVITSFILGGKPNHSVVEVDVEQGVSAKCEWKRGNPPQDVFIRTNKGNVTTQPHDDGQTYLHRDVTKSAKCEDTGQYRCQVDGTNQSKTVTLLVKCPPQFLDFNGANRTHQVSYGADEDLNFSIFSYKNFTECTLKSHQNEQLLECKSNRSEYVVSGAPPDWNLRLTIKNVSEEDNGTWQLRVENGVRGEATVNFTLDVMLLLKTKEDDMSLWWKPLPIIISCVVVVAALGLCVIITVCYRSRKKSKGQDRGVIIRTGDADTQGGGRQDRGSGSHFYEEIPEIPRTQRFHHHGQRQIPQPRGSPALPPTPAVDNLPGDYLHPVNNTPSTSGTNQSAVASAAPAGQYESLEMSDVGLRSAYSQLGM